MFSMLLEEIQQCTMNVWHIPMEVAQETEGIAKFKASRHHVWIQATRDPKKAWLNMQYCVTKGGSGLDHQRLACAVAVTSRKTRNEDRHNAVLQAQRYDQSRLISPNR
jgi:hypothetical protein